MSCVFLNILGFVDVAVVGVGVLFVVVSGISGFLDVCLSWSIGVIVVFYVLSGEVVDVFFSFVVIANQ